MAYSNPQTGMTTFMCKVNHSDTTKENEQKLMFELYKQVEHEVMNALLSGRQIVVQVTDMIEDDQGENGDDEIVYALGVSIELAREEDSEIGDYVFLEFTEEYDIGQTVHNGSSNMTYQLDEYGWKRVE